MAGPPPLQAPEFPKRAFGEILENRPVAPETFILKIHEPTVAPAIKAGQFVNIKCTDGIVPLLRRPMSVHRLIRHGDVVTGFAILYDVIGPGTKALAAMPKGKRLDFVGPLGNQITVPPGTTRAVLVAGGIGVGPVKFVAEELQRRGIKDITVCYGSRSDRRVVPNEDVAPHGCRLLMCTDDGSVGRKGRVTMLVEEMLAGGRITPTTYLFACGPHAMFRALQAVLGPRGLACEAATEEFMGCGFGVCFGCTLRYREDDGRVGYRLCCADGCLFPLDRLVLDGPGGPGGSEGGAPRQGADSKHVHDEKGKTAAQEGTP